MKLVFSLFFFSFLPILMFAQLPAINTCLGTDVSVCEGQTVTISQCGGTSTGGIYLNNPSLLTFTDDEYSPVVNIGFNFNFYGNNYNQIVLGSNGIVTFNTSQANGYCPWSSTTLPNPSTSGVLNSIALSWQDLYFPFAGGLAYQTIGTAPNRQFVISYENISYFDVNCQTSSDCFTSSIVLYEGSNIIEMFISNKSFCLAWNNGLAVQGIQDATGTNATTVPGRNNTAWSAQLDGQRFTPLNSTNYSLTTIPFISVQSANSTTTQWKNTLGQTFPYVNGVPLSVNTIPAGTTGYFLTASTCGASIASISDTTFVTRMNSSVSISMTPDFCNLSLGSATATALTGTAPYTYNWSNGAITQTITGLSVGNYTVTMTTADQCPATGIISITTQPITYSGIPTLVSCPSGNNGSAQAIMNPSNPLITYLWDDPLAQTTQIASGLIAGTYNCTLSTPNGCIGNVQVIVTETPGMIASIANQQNVPCNNGNTGMVEINVIQGTPNYSYSWDKSASTTNIANDLRVGINTATITDINGCSTSISATITEPPVLSITTITSDTTICPENNIILSSTGTGGSTAYTYTWTENNVIIGTGSTITVNPVNSGTIYCVTLTEACGSPSVDSCMKVSFHKNIFPSLIPNKTEACTFDKFEFINTSTPSSEISTTSFDFGDNNSILEQTTDSTSHTYISPDEYTITMTIKSIFNCIYTSSFPDLVISQPSPIADFGIISNPTTIFETNIDIIESSSEDVISWNWYSPGSDPTMSTDQDPSFNFPIGIINKYPITLYVTTDLGCTDSITYELNVVSDVQFYAPNAFTPDGDEHNQTWKLFVDGIDETAFHLSIFNRWGEIVWETKDISAEWDGYYKGEKVNEGAFNWVASTKDLYTDKKRTFSGSISLLR